MIEDWEKLKKKYPDLIEEVDKIKLTYDKLTNYFASIIYKKQFSRIDMFFMSVVNRANQCIFAANYCLLNDLPFPLVNVVRQLIEIYAINEYIIDDKENFEKAFMGKHKHTDENLKMPNVYTVVQKLKKKDPIALEVYDEYSEMSHPNSRSVFSAFKGGESDKYTFSGSSYSKEIDKGIAYHMMRNISGFANRIYSTSKLINPLDKYIEAKDIK